MTERVSEDSDRSSLESASLIKKEFGHIPRLESTTLATRVSYESWPLISSVSGSLSQADGFFLLSLIEKTRPSNILEIGVLAGGSTLLMLKHLSALGSQTAVTSVDALEYCFPDPSKKLAFLVFANLSPVPANWTLLGGYGAANFWKAPSLQKYNLRRGYDFAFIDAHHGHPWPAIDALCLLPFMVAGSWVALHDVALTILNEKWSVRGPQYLLQKWPLNGYLGNSALPNIGAICLSDAGSADVERLLTILEIPWEYGLGSWEDIITSHLKSYLLPGQMRKVGSIFDQYRHRNLPLW